MAAGFGNIPPFYVVGTPVSSGAQTFSGDKSWVNAVADQGTLAKWTPAAYLALTASTENVDINFNLARTVQFATGALTLQRAFLVQAPTYGAVAASTISNASTFAVDGPPVAGANVTLTKKWSATFGPVGNTTIGTVSNAVGIFGTSTTQLVIRNTGNSIEGFFQVDTTAASIGSSTSSSLKLITNNTNKATLTSGGDFLFNATGSALATSATVGFSHLPNCAGTPSGVPAALATGATPIVVDTTGSKIWFYIGGAWKGVVVA